MLKKIMLVFVAVCLVISCAFAVTPVITSQSKTVAVKEVLPAAKSVASENKNLVNGARFLNMLNRNYVYGEDFYDIHAIVNNSAAALLDRVDSDGYISEVYVAEYLKDMYGLSVDGLDEINSDFGYKKGFVCVSSTPRIHFEHELLEIIENEDGSYTVLTSVTGNSDFGSESLNAVTLFVKNENSIFGYSIVHSDFVSGLCKA